MKKVNPSLSAYFRKHPEMTDVVKVEAGQRRLQVLGQEGAVLWRKICADSANPSNLWLRPAKRLRYEILAQDFLYHINIQTFQTNTIG